MLHSKFVMTYGNRANPAPREPKGMVDPDHKPWTQHHRTAEQGSEGTRNRAGLRSVS